MPEDEVDEQSSTRPFWSGTISFGLVSIPVNLFPANRSSHVGVRMLAPDGTPLRRRYFSSKTNRELAPEEMVRGYEIEKDRFVLVSDEELDKLEPEKSRDIDLRRFVNVDQIPPIYFERGYFLAPAADSTKAYQLLAAIMEKTRRAGIATFVMRGKEYLIAIVSENGILRAETMRFKDELRSPADVGLPEKSDVPAELTHRFEQIIKKKSEEELSRDELHDETAAALLDLVKAKQARKENVVVSGATESEAEEPASLLGVLKKSLRPHGRERLKRRKRGAAHPARRSRAQRPRPTGTAHRAG